MQNASVITVLELLIVFFTAISIIYISIKESFSKAIKYFTIQSNIFSALASLTCALFRLFSSVPGWLLIIKFAATCSVTVTFVTVMVYLGPRYKNWGFLLLADAGLWLHLTGPIVAIVTLILQKSYLNFPFAVSFVGLAPVVLYGMLYTKKVILDPVEKRWEDLYGFCTGVNMALSTVLMFVGSYLISLGLWALLSC